MAADLAFHGAIGVTIAEFFADGLGGKVRDQVKLGAITRLDLVAQGRAYAIGNDWFRSATV